MSPTITARTAPAHSSQSSPLSQFGRIASRLMLVLQIYKERRALLALSDHMLKDIGLSRSQIHREAMRGLFDIPDQHPADRRRRDS
jgi:uncharacterized protein YjiS (DUF1127 family)